jgi:hypothetical protein
MANPSDAGVVWLSENEVLNRQVHSGQMKGTEPNYLAFRPLKSHTYTLSTTREWLGPQESYRQHVMQLNKVTGAHLQSAGTWGISVEECARVELDAFDDSALLIGRAATFRYRSAYPNRQRERRRPDCKGAGIEGPRGRQRGPVPASFWVRQARALSPLGTQAVRYR